jgi:hypothetical protein
MLQYLNHNQRANTIMPCILLIQMLMITGASLFTAVFNSPSLVNSFCLTIFILSLTCNCMKKAQLALRFHEPGWVRILIQMTDIQIGMILSILCDGFLCRYFVCYHFCLL